MIRRKMCVLILAVVVGGACARPADEASAPEPGGDPADPREAAVLAVVQTFFDTMTARDAASARRLLVMDGQFHSIRVAGAGATLRTTPLTSYIEGLESEGPRQVERMWDPVVLVDDRIAMVWTPYDFRSDDQVSHCGIDVFSMVRSDDGWRIASVTYTVEPDGCQRLGQPAIAGADE